MATLRAFGDMYLDADEIVAFKRFTRTYRTTDQDPEYEYHFILRNGQETIASWNVDTDHAADLINGARTRFPPAIQNPAPAYPSPPPFPFPGINPPYQVWAQAHPVEKPYFGPYGSGSSFPGDH